MSKITLSDLVNLENQTTAVSAINDNNAILEDALTNTLSRDGDLPNHMLAVLDMNSNRIINLPQPVSAFDPLRLQDLEDFLDGGLNITIADFKLTRVVVTGTNYTYASSDSYLLLVRSNGGAVMVDTLPNPALTNKTLIYVVNNDTSILAIKPASGKTINNSTEPVYIGSKQSIVLFSDGTSYFTVGKPEFAKLGTNTTFYVNNFTGNDTTNSGLSPTDAFETPQRSYDILQRNFDINTFVATIQIADSTYTTNFALSGAVKGVSSYGSIVYQGNISTPTNVVIRPASSASGVSLSGGAKATFKGIEFRSILLNGITVVEAGTQAAIVSVAFGPTGGAHIYCSGMGQVTVLGNYLITGSADSHITAVVNSLVDAEGAYTYTAVGSISFTVSVSSRYGAVVDHKLGTFSGTFTGKRYEVGSLALIHTQGGGASYFPGNSAGTNDGTGFYD